MEKQGCAEVSTGLAVVMDTMKNLKMAFSTSGAAAMKSLKMAQGITVLQSLNCRMERWCCQVQMTSGSQKQRKRK